MINKKVINKSLKYLAVSLFVFAMVANIQITLTDPFMFTSEMVLAQESGTGDSGTDYGGMCCQALAQSCDHPMFGLIAESKWVPDVTSCSGYECTDC